MKRVNWWEWPGGNRPKRRTSALNTSTPRIATPFDPLWLKPGQRGDLPDRILYLVEGFKDVIAMHAAGFTNTAGLCGTQMAAGQKKLICRYARQVKVIMDGDTPGRDAAVKIAESLNAEDIEVDIILLPEGSDPDSLFREKGKEGFAGYIHAIAHQPHPAEQLMMATLLLYPALHEGSGENDTWWPEQVAYWLRDEDVLPEAHEHQLLIDHYTGQGADATLPPDLLPTAHYLREHFTQEVTTLCRNFRDKLQTDQEQARRYLLQDVFAHYCEVRLCCLIRTFNRSLRQKPPETNRSQLLRELLKTAETTGPGLPHTGTSRGHLIHLPSPNY